MGKKRPVLPLARRLQHGNVLGQSVGGGDGLADGPNLVDANPLVNSHCGLFFLGWKGPGIDVVRTGTRGLLPAPM